MWKREEPGRPGASVTGADTMAKSQAQGASGQRIRGAGGPLGRDVVNIGKSVIIKGELSGSEDLTIEGHVDGKIELRQHVLTVGPNGKLKAQVFAKAVVVMGEVHGNITATDKNQYSREWLGGRRHHGATRRDRRRGALPGQHRHAALAGLEGG